MKQMKDSGIEWIGDVPQHWNLQKIATLYQVRNQKVSDKDFPPLSVTMKGIVPQLETAAKTNDGDNRKLVRVGDFAINSRSDRRGSCGISSYDGSVSLINTVLTPKGEMNPKYYDWLFHTVQFADEYYKCGHGIVDDLWTTTWQEMKRITIPTPPIDDQRTIAEFLDKKCEEVDGLIADIQKQIDTLEQYKRSTITEAVTKGLNPTAEMKDSNIQWVGKIPAHWGSLPIYVLFEEVTKKNIFGKEKQALQFRYGTIAPKENFEADDDLYVAKTILNYNIVEPGVIMLNGLNLNFDFVTQRVALVRDKGIITSAYMAIKSKNFNAMNPEYSTYLLKSYDICKAFHNMGGGVRKILNFEELKRNYIIVPPIDEQKSIAEYLDKKCAEIDACIEEKKQQISGLETYKKSIIFEYVTGKKEVV